MSAFDAFRRADRSADIVLTVLRSFSTFQENYRRYSMEQRRVAGLEQGGCRVLAVNLHASRGFSYT